MQGRIQDLKKRGGAEGSGARPQDFFGQFRGLFKEFGAKRGVRTPFCAPSGFVPEMNRPR